MRPRSARRAAPPPAGRAAPHARRGRRRRRCANLGSRYAKDQRVTLTAATTQGRDTRTATATLQLEREVKSEPSARSTNWVTEGDRATVDIDAVVGDTEVLHRLDGDGGERLIYLVEVEAALVDTRAASGLGDCCGRLRLQRRVGAGDHAVVPDLRKHRYA